MDYTEMLESLKRLIRVDYDEEDEKLLELIQAAEVKAVAETNRTAEELAELGGGDYPLPVKQAIKMLAGFWFENPTAMISGSQKESPYGFSCLISPYVKSL